MPIKLPFVLKVSTALERHVSWNYLDFCGYFFSDLMGPQARFIQTPVQSGSGSLCFYYLWLWTGFAKDFKNFSDAGEQLRLFSGNWCGHISAENKSDISSVSPWGPRSSATFLMALIWWLRYPQKVKQSRADFPPYLWGWENSKRKKSWAEMFYYFSVNSRISARQSSFIYNLGNSLQLSKGLSLVHASLSLVPALLSLTQDKVSLEVSPFKRNRLSRRQIR